MTGFFDRMLGRSGKEGSSAIAKSRLEVVLVHDRIDLSPERLREMKEELLAVIAKYVPIDLNSVAIAVEQPDRNSSRLVAHIPFGKGKFINLAALDEYTEDDDLGDDMPELSDKNEDAAAPVPDDSPASSEPDATADSSPENPNTD